MQRDEIDRDQQMVERCLAPSGPGKTVLCTGTQEGKSVHLLVADQLLDALSGELDEKNDDVVIGCVAGVGLRG